MRAATRWCCAALLAQGLLSACCLTSTSVVITGVQDGARLAQSTPVPLGGRIEAGRVAGSGSFRVDVPTASEERSGQRTPLFSGNVLLGIGLDRGDASFDCRFAEARLGLRGNPMLPATNPHDGTLWRCSVAARYAAAVGRGVQLLFGTTLSVENALIQRDIRSVQEISDQPLFGGAVLRETTIATFNERRVVGLFGASVHGTLHYDPHRFVSLEGGLALLMVPTIPRSVGHSWFACQRGGGPTPDDLGFYEFGVAGMGWVGAAFGPQFLRLVLRANGSAGSAGAVSGAAFGAEAALVLSTQVFKPSLASRAEATVADRSSSAVIAAP
jgi:hypothetical protein